MIRHFLDLDQLRANIKKEDPRWFEKAERRTEKLVAAGGFAEATSIWSSAKPAYMVQQSNKCAFCERPFSGPDESRIEMDLEHFRPKSAVREWTRPDGAKPYPKHTGGPSEHGYYWLAYEILNYAAACKICNSDYKSSFFPIVGRRCTAPGRPSALKSENALLIYPIGSDDEDPEDIITFTGTIAHPVKARGPKHYRAVFIIDFFELNDRDQLHIQRAETIERFGKALIAVTDGSATPADNTYVAQILNPLIPHAACLRAFKKLWDRDRNSAVRIFHACREMLAKRLLDPTARGLGVGLQ